MAKKKGKTEFSFPTKVQCPRCGSTRTRATSTQGEKQYRTCAQAVCRWRFCIKGQPVIDKKQNERKKDAEEK